VRDSYLRRIQLDVMERLGAMNFLMTMKTTDRPPRRELDLETLNAA